MRKGIVVDVTAAGLARCYAMSSAQPPPYWGLGAVMGPYWP